MCERDRVCVNVFVVAEGHWVSGVVEMEAAGQSGSLKLLLMLLEVMNKKREQRRRGLRRRRGAGGGEILPPCFWGFSSVNTFTPFVLHLRSRSVHDPPRKDLRPAGLHPHLHLKPHHSPTHCHTHSRHPHTEPAPTHTQTCC